MKEIKRSHSIIKTPQGDVCFNYTADVYTAMISGGIDSAVTFYTMCKTISENSQKHTTIYPLHVVRKNSTDIGVYDFRDTSIEVKTIVEFVRAAFPKLNIKDVTIDHSDFWWVYQHTQGNKIERKYVIAQQSLVNFIEWKYKDNKNININHYHGNTRAPLVGNLPSLSSVVNSKNATTVTDRDKDSAQTLYNGSVTKYFSPTKNIAYYQPFRNADKRMTFWLADKLGILNDLNTMTNSCEGNKYETGNFKYTCNTCWFCLERQWALDNYKN